jgi:hypothetical protein
LTTLARMGEGKEEGAKGRLTKLLTDATPQQHGHCHCCPIGHRRGCRRWRRVAFGWPSLCC